MEIFRHAFGLYGGLVVLLALTLAIAVIVAPDLILSRLRTLRNFLWPRLSPRFVAAHVFSFVLLFASCVEAIPASAQSFGTSVFSYPGVRATYSAAIVGMTPASSATDLFTIAGAAGKVVRVTRIRCNGTSTALGNSLLQVVKRSAVDTAGTKTNPVAIPHDSADPAAAAVVAAYTANPTLGTSVGVVRVGFIGTGTATALGSDFVQEFGPVSDKQAILRSAAEQLAVNANAASLAAGAALSCTVEWTESAT